MTLPLLLKIILYFKKFNKKKTAKTYYILIPQVEVIRPFIAAKSPSVCSFDKNLKT